MKNNTEWAILTQTTSPCEVSMFELAVIGTIWSVLKNNKTLANLANLANFALGKRFLGENENQKMKQKIQIQVKYTDWKITFYFLLSF